MGQFANGPRAWGTCDRCGRRQLLKRLSDQIVNRRPTGIMVCRSCLDKDHPQLQLGETPVDDPQALRMTRPDVTLPESRPVQWGWAPAGLPWAMSTEDNDLRAVGRVGTVTITYVEPA